MKLFKQIILISTICTLTLIGTVFAHSLTIPSIKINKSLWAIEMTEKACHVDFDASHFGEIYETQNGVIYKVYNSKKQEVSSAWAKNGFSWSRKECLN